MVALAPTFTPHVSAIATWICICVACVMVALLLHEVGAKKHTPSLNLLTIPLCCVFLLYGWWLVTPPLMDVIFRNPSGIGTWRRYQIRRDMTEFHQYLSTLGFDLPSTLPTVGVESLPYATVTPDGKETPILGPQYKTDCGAAVGATSPSNYGWIITIGTTCADNPFFTVYGYCQQMFFILFDVSDPDKRPKPEFINRLAAMHTMSAYFSYSYMNRLGREIGGRWVNALWRIREIYGSEFADHALVYAYRFIDSPQPGDTPDAVGGSADDTFDIYFRTRLMRGVAQMDLTEQTENEINAILKSRGIHVPPSSSVGAK